MEKIKINVNYLTRDLQKTIKIKEKSFNYFDSNKETNVVPIFI